MKKIVLILTIVILAGCGNKKNPTEEFAARAVPPHDTPIRERFIDTCPVMNVVGSLVVVEGKSISKEIEIVGGKSTDELLISGGDKSIVINPSKKSVPNGIAFQLNYTAPKGIVEVGKPPVQIPFSLVLQSKAKPSSEEELKKCAKSFEIIVVRTFETPIITKLNASAKEFSVDSTALVTATAEINAPGADSADDLDPSFKPDRTTNTKENPVWNLTPAVVDIFVQKVRDGVFQVNFKIDPQLVKYILKNEVKGGKRDLVTQLRVYNNRSQLMSQSKNLVITAVIPAPPAPPVKKGEKK